MIPKVILFRTLSSAIIKNDHHFEAAKGDHCSFGHDGGMDDKKG
jgi:hypothetical protein